MDTQLSTSQAVLGALGITALLVVLHLAAPRIRKLPLLPEAATGSFAGGLAVAYVFLHLLPDVVEGNEAIGDALDNVLKPTPLIDLATFLVALAGFTAFFALERLADRTAGPRRSAADPAQGDDPHARRRPASTGCTSARSWCTTR